MVGENKEQDYKNGKWVYLDSNGDIQRISKFKRGKIKRTKLKTKTLPY